RTKIDIPLSINKINHQHTIVSFGSCFAANIGQKLQQLYFQADINPFGVQYNPLSVFQSVERLLENKIFAENELFEHKSLYHSALHDSSFSDISAEKTLQNINDRYLKAVEKLQNADFLFVTFGTAWVFEQKESGNIVSNCHKLPAENFVRRRLTVAEIVEKYTELIKKLKALNPKLSIVLTVSPVRHFKDGAHENNVSKSTLLLAVDTLQKDFDFVSYFPAYEIVMDELRDYRFYAADMLHPSEVAIDYVFQRFVEVYFSPDTQQLIKKLEQYNADKNHRPLHPESAEYQLFLQNMKKREDDIRAAYPLINIEH
ncbi:MAG: GSCFA domain-containing protein, partial [Prevotellaceae bacterium]|nr:GSCFA domain-containing protein [Prevotellaceae bacterium]